MDYGDSISSLKDGVYFVRKRKMLPYFLMFLLVSEAFSYSLFFGAADIRNIGIGLLSLMAVIEFLICIFVLELILLAYLLDRERIKSGVYKLVYNAYRNYLYFAISTIAELFVIFGSAVLLFVPVLYFGPRAMPVNVTSLYEGISPYDSIKRYSTVKMDDFTALLMAFLPYLAGFGAVLYFLFVGHGVETVYGVFVGVFLLSYIISAFTVSSANLSFRFKET
jgi:hypothetical protein